MVPGRNKLYLLLSVACVAGYIWLFINHLTWNNGDSPVGVCIIKHVTNIPCPSCGSTRAVYSILQGDILGSLYLNPFGLLLTVIMVASPLWILYDIVNKSQSLFNFYVKAETFLKQKHVAIPAILLVLANWAWNICKDL